MSRPVRPVMDWSSNEPSDPDGRVVWWARVGDHQAEVHHLGPYRARLRVWPDRGASRPVLDVSVSLPADNRANPAAEVARGWLQQAEQAAAGSIEIECRWPDDVSTGDRLLRALSMGVSLADAVEEDAVPGLAALVAQSARPSDPGSASRRSQVGGLPRRPGRSLPPPLP